MILILNWNRPYFIRMTTATCVLCRSHHTLGNIMTNKKNNNIHTSRPLSLSPSFLSSFGPILSAFSSTAKFQSHSPSALVMYSLVEICLRFRFSFFSNDTFCQLLQSSCTVEHVLSGVFVCACYFFLSSYNWWSAMERWWKENYATNDDVSEILCLRSLISDNGMWRMAITGAANDLMTWMKTSAMIVKLIV